MHRGRPPPIGRRQAPRKLVAIPFHSALNRQRRVALLRAWLHDEAQAKARIRENRSASLRPARPLCRRATGAYQLHRSRRRELSLQLIASATAETSFEESPASRRTFFASCYGRWFWCAGIDKNASLAANRQTVVLVEGDPGYAARTVAAGAVSRLVEGVGQFPFLRFVAPLGCGVSDDVV
jgi:hypothetical protein